MSDLLKATMRTCQSRSECFPKFVLFAPCQQSEGNQDDIPDKYRNGFLRR